MGSSDLRTTCVTRPPSISAALLATARPDGPAGSRSGKPDQRPRSRDDASADASAASDAARRVEEAGALEQVARRVAGQGQLREERQLGALPLGRGRGLEHEPPVALEVADGRVDLSERDLHGDILPTTRRTARRPARVDAA